MSEHIPIEAAAEVSAWRQVVARTAMVGIAASGLLAGCTASEYSRAVAQPVAATAESLPPVPAAEAPVDIVTDKFACGQGSRENAADARRCLEAMQEGTIALVDFGIGKYSDTEAVATQLESEFSKLTLGAFTPDVEVVPASLATKRALAKTGSTRSDGEPCITGRPSYVADEQMQLTPAKYDFILAISDNRTCNGGILGLASENKADVYGGEFELGLAGLQDAERGALVLRRILSVAEHEAFHTIGEGHEGSILVNEYERTTSEGTIITRPTGLFSRGRFEDDSFDLTQYFSGGSGGPVHYHEYESGPVMGYGNNHSTDLEPTLQSPQLDCLRDPLKILYGPSAGFERSVGDQSVRIMTDEAAAHLYASLAFKRPLSLAQNSDSSRTIHEMERQGTKLFDSLAVVPTVELDEYGTKQIYRLTLYAVSGCDIAEVGIIIPDIDQAVTKVPVIMDGYQSNILVNTTGVIVTPWTERLPGADSFIELPTTTVAPR